MLQIVFFDFFDFANILKSIEIKKSMTAAKNIVSEGEKIIFKQLYFENDTRNPVSKTCWKKVSFHFKSIKKCIKLSL